MYTDRFAAGVHLRGDSAAHQQRRCGRGVVIVCVELLVVWPGWVCGFLLG